MTDQLPIEIRRIEENEQLKRVLELRVAGMDLHKACLTVGVPVARMRKALDEWFAKNPALSAQAFREQELSVLEEMQEVLLRHMRMKYVLVNAGKVVYSPLVDPDTGRQVQHPELGFPILGAPMEDVEPQRNAVMAIIKLQERKSKMMGADLPSVKEVAPAGGDGKDVKDLTPEEERAAMEHWARKMNRIMNKGSATDVVVTPVDKVDE